MVLRFVFTISIITIVSVLFLSRASAQTWPPDSIPAIFTPNGDGINDLFVIPGSTAQNGSWPALVVFSRWGTEVYTSRPYENDWGGKSPGGDDLPDGTYYYVLEGGTTADLQANGYIMISR